jgi:hypothetical protein
MTICAAVPVVNLEKHPHIRFVEPAVIMAADSRISFSDGSPPYDGGVKVLKLSDFAIAGFSGNVAIAQRSFKALAGEIASSCVETRRIVQRAQVLLNERLATEKARGKPEELLRTDALVAISYGGGRIRLYLLSSIDAFEPTRVEEVKAIGDGAKEFEETFKPEFSSIITAWQRRALGPRAFQKGTNQYHEDLTALPVDTTDRWYSPNVKWLEVCNCVGATISEVLDLTKRSSIGGKVQVMAVTSRQVTPVTLYKSRDDGKTWGKA